MLEAVFMEPESKPVEKQVSLDNITVIRSPQKTPPGVWIRRVVVWSVVIAVFSWAFVSCYQVFSHSKAKTPNLVNVHIARTLPTSTGEYKYEKARELFTAGRNLLRAGDFSGLTTLEEVIRSYPDAPQARQAILVIASTQRYQLKQPKKALAEYELFVRTYPGDAQVVRALGAIRDISGELKETDASDNLARLALQKVTDNPPAKARLEKWLTPKP
jgi:hypothetical protein